RQRGDLVADLLDVASPLAAIAFSHCFFSFLGVNQPSLRRETLVRAKQCCLKRGSDCVIAKLSCPSQSPLIGTLTACPRGCQTDKGAPAQTRGPPEKPVPKNPPPAGGPRKKAAGPPAPPPPPFSPVSDFPSPATTPPGPLMALANRPAGDSISITIRPSA